MYKTMIIEQEKSKNLHVKLFQINNVLDFPFSIIYSIGLGVSPYFREICHEIPSENTQSYAKNYFSKQRTT